MPTSDETGRYRSWELKPARIFGLQCVGVATLLLLSLFANGANNSTLDDLKITRFLDVSSEGNLPATYNGALLIFASVLLYLIGFAQNTGPARFSKHWLGLGVVLSYLSIDELAGIHELFGSIGLLFERVGWTWAYSGVFYRSWVLAGIVATGIAALVFQRFIRSLPRRTRAYFLLAAALYVIGALGMEMVGSRITEAAEQGSVAIYAPTVVSHIEEALEMVGVVVLIYALLDYARPVVVSVDGTNRRIEFGVGC